MLCTVGDRVSSFADQCAVFPNASYATTADLEFSKELVVRVVDDCLSFFRYRYHVSPGFGGGTSRDSTRVPGSLSAKDCSGMSKGTLKRVPS